MLSLEMLDVAIGMIFIYLLISLICSAINEFIEAKLKLRAVDLEQGIRELLNDYDGKGLTKDIYNHSLIYSLFRGEYDTSQMRVNKNSQKNRYSRGSDLPSYIPAKNFALALMDILLPATSTTKSGTEGATAAPNDHLPTPNSTGPQLPPVNTNPLKPLRDAVCNVTNIKVKSALLTIIDAAGDDVSKAREGIENWYNSGMDRVSGWYKRRVQTIVFCMGFALAIIMNADSFAIFNNLVNDRPLRAAVVAAAVTFNEATNANDTTNKNNKDITKKSAANKSTADTTKKNNIRKVVKKDSENNIKKNVNSLLELGLPIGWNWKSYLNQHPTAITNFNAIPQFDPDSLSTFIDSLGSWLVKIIGWLVTGFAVSLGAPFWFDILNRIMIVRSTVKPHEKSPEEASQDRQNPKT